MHLSFICITMQRSTVNCTFPAGIQYSEMDILLDQPTLKIYKMNDLPTGQWTVAVNNDRNPYSVSVAGSSVISFSYQICVAPDNPYDGYMPICGKPLKGRISVTLKVVSVHACYSCGWPRGRSVLRSFGNWYIVGEFSISRLGDLDPGCIHGNQTCCMSQWPIGGK